MKKIAYLALIAFIASASVVASASESTRKAPKDFTLEAINGEDFKLSEAKGKFVVLHFLLKTYCPICQMHTRTYAQHAKEHPNAEFLFIKPDEKSETEKWMKGIPKDELKKAPTIYQDKNAMLAKAFGIPHGYKFHGEVVHYPAAIILGPDGKELFRHVGKKTQDRFTYEMFKKKMKELKAGSGTTN